LPVIQEIVEQHAEEAAFLWLLRDAAVRAPHYNLKDIAHLDDRVEAHIDGLRIAEEAGWDLCCEALKHREAGEGFSAGVLAIESGDKARVDFVMEAAVASPELARGVASAFGWVPFERSASLSSLLFAASSPTLRRIGIAARAIHRRDPGEALSRAIADEDVTLRARALRAAGELGRVDLLGRTRSSLQDADEPCRFFAACSTALLGDRAAAAPVLCALSETGGFRASEACALAVRCLPVAAAQKWLETLVRRPENLRLAVVGAGALGEPSVAPWLIDRMATPELARVAGEAFSGITGIDITYQGLEGERPEGFESGPTEAPEDESVAMDQDEDLPWPNPEPIARWWKENYSRFQGGTRYLLGEPVSPERAMEVLGTGWQRQRIAAAIELAMTKPGQILFEVRAPGIVQQRLLERA
jgi:uncharacterized protein (TIGR02270 family)